MKTVTEPATAHEGRQSPGVRGSKLYCTAQPNRKQSARRPNGDEKVGGGGRAGCGQRLYHPSLRDKPVKKSVGLAFCSKTGKARKVNETWWTARISKQGALKPSTSLGEGKSWVAYENGKVGLVNHDCRSS